jgi:DNA-binding SARP family transcriptional activator
MLRLSTLGGLVLHQDGQLHTGPAAQRRRLALLAVIASAGRRGVGRDRLLALLWPDSEAEAARHSLYQALHAIRRSLGGDDVFLGSATLQLRRLPPAVATATTPRPAPGLRRLKRP